MSILTKTVPRMAAAAMMLAFGLVAPAFGQVRSIKGKVLDETGNPVNEARITISGMEIKRNYNTKTNKKGEYFYGGLTAGKYYVGVEADGFNCDFVQGITPAANDPANVEFKLKKGPGCSKLPFMMSDEEKQKVKEQQEEAKKQQASAGAVKVDFDAGLAAATAGNYDDAIASFKKALEKDQTQPYVWANLADVYSKKKNYPEAIAAFNKAIELKPDDANLLQNLGNTYGASGDTAKAEEMYKKAASMAPVGGGGANAAAFYNLGVTQWNANKAAEAIDAFSKALAADPNYGTTNPEIHYNLGMAYINVGKVNEALASLQTYVKLVSKGKNYDDAKSWIGMLGKK